MTFGLVVLTMLVLVGSFCTYVMIRGLNSKELGMQTLYDQMLINLLHAQHLYSWMELFTNTIAYFIPNLNLYLSYIIWIIHMCFVYNVAISLTYVPLFRYILIFHAGTLDSYIDSRIISIARYD